MVMDAAGINQLVGALQAAGLPVTSGFNPPARHEATVPVTWHARAAGALVRLDWQTAPTAAQEQAADEIVQAFDGSEQAAKEARRKKVKAAALAVLTDDDDPIAIAVQEAIREMYEAVADTRKNQGAPVRTWEQARESVAARIRNRP